MSFLFFIYPSSIPCIRHLSTINFLTYRHQVVQTESNTSRFFLRWEHYRLKETLCCSKCKKIKNVQLCATRYIQGGKKNNKQSRGASVVVVVVFFFFFFNSLQILFSPNIIFSNISSNFFFFFF